MEGAQARPEATGPASIGEGDNLRSRPLQSQDAGNYGSGSVWFYTGAGGGSGAGGEAVLDCSRAFFFLASSIDFMWEAILWKCETS